MPILKGSFLLNNRFLINPDTHSIKDRQSGIESRPEPRLMEVLCILAENPGELVTRERLIKAVWDDYGGADEGLNQAISFLRKFLGDHTKEIIETIPKKGYILHAIITEGMETPSAEEKIPAPKTESRGNNYWIWGLLPVIIIAILLGVNMLKKNETNRSVTTPAHQSISNPDVLKDSTHIKKESVGADAIPPDQLNKKSSMDTGADVLRK